LDEHIIGTDNVRCEFYKFIYFHAFAYFLIYTLGFHGFKVIVKKIENVFGVEFYDYLAGDLIWFRENGIIKNLV